MRAAFIGITIVAASTAFAGAFAQSANDIALAPPPGFYWDPQKIAAAAAGAKSIGDLSAGIQTACEIQPWQISLRQEIGSNGVAVESSPTLDRDKGRCAFDVVAQSRFFLTNPKDRPQGK